MDSQTLIREIDPDYMRCEWCKRLLHRSKIEIMRGGSIVCKDVKDCADNLNVNTLTETMIRNPDKPDVINIDYLGKICK